MCWYQEEKQQAIDSPPGADSELVIDGTPTSIAELRTSIIERRDELNKCLTNVRSHYLDRERIEALSPTDIDDAVALAESVEQLTPPLTKTLGVIGTVSTNLLDHARKRLDRMDAEFREIRTENRNITKERNSLADELDDTEKQLRELKPKYETSTRFVEARLIETGFLAPGGSEPEKIDEARNAFEMDLKERSENPDYVRCLIGLREYLQREEVRSLPYYGPSGLERLRTGLEKKERDWQSLFNQDDREIINGLIGHWNEFLQYLYRSVLLLKTYWSGGTDQGLQDRLSRSQSAVGFLLDKHRIHPHEIRLLKLEKEVLETDRIVSDDNVPIPEVFSESRALPIGNRCGHRQQGARRSGCGLCALLGL